MPSPNYKYENQLLNDGYTHIAGVDEVGRGCIAGPVVAAAVIICNNTREALESATTVLQDSKKCQPRARSYLYDVITNNALWAVAEISPKEIDLLNIHYASLRAMGQAIQEIPTDFILVDGKFLPVQNRDYTKDFLLKGLSIIKGDTLCASIASASIIAKVWRDRLMCNYTHIYPDYQFAQHKGYATAQHRKIIAEKGVLPIHRKSFKTVKQYLICK